MKDFADFIKNTKIEEGSLGVFFLGQAGFVFKTAEGKTVAIDPYLSDCCNRFFGFKRLMASILNADEVKFDYVISTHAHYDHFDPDSIPTLLEGGKTKFIGACDTKAEIEKLGLTGDFTYLKVYDEATLGGSDKLVAVPCDHGADTPDAIGLILTVSGKKIYVMGDTAYRPDLFSAPEISDIDLLILPINGAFGNLDELEAAKTVAMISPKLAVPSHFWNFAEHFGSPHRFMENMKSLAPDKAYTLMRQGELIKI